MLKNIFLLLMVTSLSTSYLFPYGNKDKDSLTITTEKKTVRVSWYGKKFHGRTTANGESYDMYAFTAAHKKMKFGTKVRITNINNGKSVEVRINDRGPYIKGRTFDLSKAAFLEIADPDKGVLTVEYEIVEDEIEDETAEDLNSL